MIIVSVNNAWLARSEGASTHVTAWSALTVWYGYKSQDAGRVLAGDGSDIIMLVGESEQNRGAVLTLLIGVSTKRLTDRPRSRMLMNDGGAGLRLLAGFGRSVVRRRVFFPVYRPPPLPRRVLYRPGLQRRSAARCSRPAGTAVGGTFTVTQHFWGLMPGIRRRATGQWRKEFPINAELIINTNHSPKYLVLLIPGSSNNC